MQELGQVLRTKRESLGLDLDEVQERTKIRKRYLIALENGDWSILPGYVYGRGFVRSYAEILGLDGLELLSRYIDKTSFPEQESVNEHDSREALKLSSNVRHNDVVIKKTEEPGKPAVSEEISVSRSYKSESRRAISKERVPSKATRLLSGHKFNVISQVAVIAGVLVLIGGGIYYIQRSGGSTAGESGKGPVATGSQNTSSTESRFANQTNTTGSVTSNTAGNQSVTTSTQASGTQQNGTASIIPAAFQNNVQNYTVITSQPLTVNLTAISGDCWVKVSADNNVVDGSDMISKGTQKSWPANDTLTIRVGNVSAVQIQVNGQTVQLPATTTAIDVTFNRQQPQTQ